MEVLDGQKPIKYEISVFKKKETNRNVKGELVQGEQIRPRVLPIQKKSLCCPKNIETLINIFWPLYPFLKVLSSFF